MKSQPQKNIAFSDEKASTQQLLKRLDLRIIPFLLVAYTLAFLDRVNIGHAKLYSLEESLQLSPNEYAWAISIFFIAYVTFEIPSNLLLQRLSPPVGIMRIMVTWGIVTICTAFVTNAAGLLTVRFFLGMFEAGMAPGIVYYLGMWYTKKEQASRIVTVIGATIIAGALGGLISFGLHDMEGVLGLRAWQWLYIFEGIPTIIVGILTIFILPSRPQKATWLGEEQHQLLLNRLTDEKVQIVRGFDFNQMKETFKDPASYLLALVNFGASAAYYAIVIFLPTIINGLGFSTVQSFLLTIPPYFIGLIVIFVGARLSDYYMSRSIPIILLSFTTLICFIVLILVESSWVKYGILNVALPCLASTLTIIYSWTNNNVIGGSTKAATLTAMVFMMGNIGGVIAGQLFRPSDMPQYYTSFGFCIGCSVLVCTATILLRFIFSKRNMSLKKHHFINPDDTNSPLPYIL